MDRADALSRANIAYRRPELYDALTAGDDQADALAAIVTARTAGTRSAGAGSLRGRSSMTPTVLDLGCGTGRDLAALHQRHGWHATGVDLQPKLVGYARAVRPALDVRIGDLRTVRLGRTYDVITCLGNTLAYLHTDTDLDAAAATFAAHAHPGTTLIVVTLTHAPPTPSGGAQEVHVNGVDATVDVGSRLDPSGRFVTTRRTWTFPDGDTITDEFTRRIVTPDELRHLLRGHGFTSVETGPPSVATFDPEEFDPGTVRYDLDHRDRP